MENSSAHILHGLDSIVNQDNVREGVNFQEIEKSLIGEGHESSRVEPQDRFADELSGFAKELGIDFDEPSKSESSANALSGRNSSGSYGGSESYNDKYSGASYNQDEQFDISGGHSDSESDYRSESEDEQPSHSHLESSYNSPRETSPAPSSVPSYSFDKHSYPDDLESRTKEQGMKDRIDSVFGKPSTSNFSFEKEKKEDNKCVMLSEIDSLINILEGEDIDLSRIPKVDRHSSYEDVDSVLKILRHKNDHNRYCSFADEFLLFGAYALEEMFNGKRTWLNSKPDLTGWHNHLNVKLKRMRHDTGQVMSGVMQDYNIGPGLRILLELIPSMVLYSRTRKTQHSQADLFNDDSMIESVKSLY